jgi:hypothetical protein
MDLKANDQVKQIAAQLLAGMLANPHIYATISDEGSKGQQEQELTLVAIEMAESLIQKVDSRNN